jgi:predicted GIY-YIG superfamily endonuclease
MGTVYLIHFDKPYKHARHYLGYASNLKARLACHRANQGARLIQVIHAAGITWQVSRTWSGNRALERKLKNQKNGPRLCPLCNPKLKGESQCPNEC